MPQANIIAAAGGSGDEVDRKPQSKKFLSPGQSPPSRRANTPCHLPLLRGGFFCGRLRSRGRIKSEQCTMVKSSSFRRERGRGTHISSLPLEGEGGPSKTGDEVDPYFCTNKSPFRQRRNIIARRAISFPKEISFAAGKHHCRRRRLGG